MKKILRLFLPGSFEDAQLYMGHLMVFTTERDTRLLELEALTSRLEAQYPQWQGVLRLAFARNDWLTSGVTKSLAQNPLFASALNVAFDQVANTQIALDDGDFALQPLHNFKQDADVILDTVVYAQRLYLGTTAGLYDYDIDWQELSVGAQRRRIDARCVSATAEYGAINASCEDEGLFTGYDEFGWQGLRNEATLIRTAERSVRAAWLGTDLVNYESPTTPELLSASVEAVTTDGGAADWKRKVVTRFSRPTRELDDLVTELCVQRKVDPPDVQFVWNSSRAFFINTHSHGFFSAVRASERDIRFTRHGAADGRVIAVHRYSGGWVIETDFRAYVLARGHLIELLDEEPLSVRAFEGSKRYKRIIAITVETGVHLISIIDTF
ncbi:MAG TPA: hypothetical protein VK721_13230 [Solirubrobacteraceae bacterium]|jgi:hypothetical protein|nr:hypothetical protein [Solirubrobacteraceae bacterium]